MKFKISIEEKISSEVYLWVNHEVMKRRRHAKTDEVLLRLDYLQMRKKNKNNN